jgi:hypothetical protein
VGVDPTGNSFNPNAERGTEHSVSLRMKRCPRSRDKIESAAPAGERGLNRPQSTTATAKATLL